MHPNIFKQHAQAALDNDNYSEILVSRTEVDSIPDWMMKLDELTPVGKAVLMKHQKNYDQAGVVNTPTPRNIHKDAEAY